MTTSANDPKPALAARSLTPSFYFWMIIIMAVFVFGGFGMTYLFPMATGSFPPAPAVVHLHGIVYFTWIILLITQASLVNVKNMKLHRSLGTWAIAHATAVFAMGLLITLLGAMGSMFNPGANYYTGIYLGLMAVTGFGILFCLSIRNVRKPDIHKRLILLAMLPILPPGIHRFYMAPLGLTEFPVMWMYLTLDAMAAAILVQEWKSSKAISIYTLLGVAWILAQQLLHYPVTHADWFADFVFWLSGHVHYR